MSLKIYTLKLAGGKFYVGKTKDVIRRYEAHKAGDCAWTKMYAPLNIETVVDGDDFDEDKITKQMMLRYGIQNVRGGSYVQIELTPEQYKFLTNEFMMCGNLCVMCGQSGHFVKQCPHTTKTQASVSTITCSHVYLGGKKQGQECREPSIKDGRCQEHMLLSAPMAELNTCYHIFVSGPRKSLYCPRTIVKDNKCDVHMDITEPGPTHCNFVRIVGARKGTYCNNAPIQDGYCHDHKTHSVVPAVPVMPAVPAAVVVKCERCGRDSHTAETCDATTDVRDGGDLHPRGKEAPCRRCDKIRYKLKPCECPVVGFKGFFSVVQDFAKSVMDDITGTDA